MVAMNEITTLHLEPSPEAVKFFDDADGVCSFQVESFKPSIRNPRYVFHPPAALAGSEIVIYVGGSLRDPSDGNRYAPTSVEDIIHHANAHTSRSLSVKHSPTSLLSTFEFADSVLGNVVNQSSFICIRHRSPRGRPVGRNRSVV